MNKNKALSVLKQFTDCLEDKYFLVYGTALGANREQNIISHDLDIDIGIMKDDLHFGYINSLIRAGFDMISMFGSFNYGLEMSFRKDGVKVDLMVYYQEGNIIWNSLWLNGGRDGLCNMIVHSYKNELFEIERVKVGDNVFFSLGEEYISKVYGVSWKIPVKEWNWRTDHCCIDDNLKFKLKEKYGK